MIVFIDGENFRQRLSETLANSGVITDKKEVFKFNLVGMLEEVLKTKKLNIRYYASEIKMPRGYTPSNNMQKQIALIKSHLRVWVGEIKKQNVEYIKAGNLKVKEAKPCFKCGAQQEVLQEIPLIFLKNTHKNIDFYNKKIIMGLRYPVLGFGSQRGSFLSGPKACGRGGLIAAGDSGEIMETVAKVGRCGIMTKGASCKDA